MADDTVDNEHPSFVIIANDTVNNEHPRVNAGTLGDEAEDQPTNGSTVGSKKDVDSKDDIGETDAHGHNKTDETDDGANIEDKNREIDIKGEDNRSANESVSLDQGNVQQLDNNSVKTEEKKDAYTELREDDNIGINAGTLGDEAEGQPTNGSIVGSKNDVDNKDDIGETDAHGLQKTDKTVEGTNIEDKDSEIDIKVEDNRENDSIRPDQAQVQLPEDKNDDESKGETSVHTKSCSDDNIGPNDIPKETGSVKQMKERLLHSKTGTENYDIQKLQNDVESLGNKLAESERAKLEMAQKDISNQEEISRLKELKSNLQTRLENEQQTHRKLTEEKETQSKKHKKELDEMRKKNCRVENELVQMKEENQRLKNDMKKEAEKHKKEKDQVYKKMVEKDKEIEKSKTIIQKLEEEISKIKRENVRNVTEINMQTERLLQDADQIQKNLEKKCKTLQNEIEGKTNQLQWLTSRFNQEKEGYLQQVQILTAEKKDLLLRNCRIENELVHMKEKHQRLRYDMDEKAEKHKKEMDHVYKKMAEKDKEIEESKTIIQKQEDDISKIGVEIYRLKELNTDLQTRLENELVQTHRKLAEEKETQYKKHKKDLDEMRKQMESIIAKKDEEIKKAKMDIQKHKDEISKIIRENVMQNTIANEKEKQLHATERQLVEAYQYQEKLHENFCSEIKEKDNQLQLLTYKFNQSLQDRDSFHQQVQVLTAEKTDLLLRFSKEASAKMTDNNPNIADLRDEKRPTKLAEEFSELYDNEWTDAFETIEGENEKEKLTFLLELLIRANQLCMDLSNRHTRKVKQSIATLTLLKPNRQEQHRTGECLDKEKLRQGEHEKNLQERVQAKDDAQSQTESGCGSDKKSDMSESQKKRLESDFEKLQTKQKETILEATKFFETLLTEDVKKALKEVIVNEKRINEKEHTLVISYLDKCINLCWSMLRHKPPVHVDFPDIVSDTPFDTNKYKPYTKTGKHLAYIVWPALYLHEGGPLLSKGVAQGK